MRDEEHSPGHKVPGQVQPVPEGSLPRSSGVSRPPPSHTEVKPNYGSRRASPGRVFLQQGLQPRLPAGVRQQRQNGNHETNGQSASCLGGRVLLTHPTELGPDSAAPLSGMLSFQYRNECLMKLDSCRRNRNLHVVYTGNCSMGEVTYRTTLADVNSTVP